MFTTNIHELANGKLNVMVWGEAIEYCTQATLIGIAAAQAQYEGYVPNEDGPAVTPGLLDTIAHVAFASYTK